MSRLTFMQRRMHVSLNLILTQAVVVTLLSACASDPSLPPTPEIAEQSIYDKQPSYNRPYKINGKTYYPLASADGYRERGLASWYGAESGGRTAMGSLFRPNQLSAAHKILPLPCKVRVTNLRNGRAIEVLVNDRGPFHPNRVIDLSQGAAKQLGMRGTTEVEIEYLERASGVF